MKTFLERARGFIPRERIYTDELRRLAWGTDAGFYRLVPKVVIRTAKEEEISRLMELASETGTPLTFRAAGTSLSGQAVSDSVLVVAGKNWEKWEYHPKDQTVTLQPGLVGAQVNKLLAPYGRHFGPDPASIGSCMVGGIVMNNASGMSCGTHANSDRVMTSARMVLADGTVLDTGSPESREAFRKSHPEFLQRIEALRDRVLANKALSERIRYKYSIKNVTGLNLLPLITFQDPFDIMAHLLVGSEGTLAFLSEVTMKTLPIAPFKASAMIYFRNIRSAAEGVVAMPRERISAAELLDIRSLTAVSDPHLSPDIPGLTAVLTETQATSHEELLENIAAIEKALEPFGVEVAFTEDPSVYSAYWAIRAGIFPAVGGLREEGTTCLIEDVAFHIQDLPAATEELSALLDKHGYTDSCIYGHALEGNFHFIINQAFATEADVRRYEAMIRDVAQLVVGRYDGSLKAEHGTGRNMAPFVAYEWGPEAFAVMKEIKALFDPKGLMNPGVIFNDDPNCFIKDFKALPLLKPSNPEDQELAQLYKQLNKCIECGFCEVNCVSCGFTLSSRTRIVARREIARLQESGENPELLKKLLQQYRYAGNVTCAGDGLCSTSCPMGINVADLTHEIRREEMSAAGKALGTFAAQHFHAAKNGVRVALGLARAGETVLGDKAMSAVCEGLHKGIGLPLWTVETPGSYRVPAFEPQKESPLKVVYFPSCINQAMGLAKNAPVKRPLVEETVDLLQKAGYEVIFPAQMDSLCCGTIWESKGMPQEAEKKVRELDDALWKASQQGRYPVLCDQSPCLHRMRKCISRMKLYEPAEFIWTFLRDKLVFTPTETPVALHLTCSTRLMKVDKILIDLAKLCSTQVLVPEGVGCCGYAGDKGMTHPELNSWALRKLRGQVQGIPMGYSNSRTCEIGLSHNSGIPYVSIVYLVNACTKHG